MAHVLLASIFVIDLALFVLVFLIVRTRRVSPRNRGIVIGLAAAAYLVSLVLLIVISSRL